MILEGLLLIDPAQPPAPGWLEVADGRITAMETGSPAAADLGHSRAIICPGFVDAHHHLPQIDAVGVDGLELLQWLEEAIFPAEAKWADARMSATQIRDAAHRMIEAGTLGVAGYLTSHRHGPELAARILAESGMRATVGQVLMDRNAPADLLHAAAESLPATTGRFEASVNPRFAICCSEPMLTTAGDAANAGRVIQTHLAESRPECDQVRMLFPDDASYTAVYDRFGLLTPRTLLAHCVHLDHEQWTLIHRRRSVVVHCPTANTFLRSGCFDLKAAREHAVTLALGSDVAAGPDTAMPRVARAMIEVAKLRALTVDDRADVPTPAEAWRVITDGNAEALGWHRGPRLAIGADADLLVLEVPFDIDDHLIGRLIYTWRNDYIAHRVIHGRVYETSRQ